MVEHLRQVEISVDREKNKGDGQGLIIEVRKGNVEIHDMKMNRVFGNAGQNGIGIKNVTQNVKGNGKEVI